LERDAIGNFNIGNFSFSKGRGGTLTLGGTANGNGLMQVKNGLGTKTVEVDKDGIRLFGTTALRCSFDAGAGTPPNDLAYFGPAFSGTTVAGIMLQTDLAVPFYYGMNGPATFQMGAFSTGTLDVNGILEINNGTSGGLGTIIGGYFTGTAAYSATGGSSLSGGTILLDGGFINISAPSGAIVSNLGIFQIFI